MEALLSLELAHGGLRLGEISKLERFEQINRRAFSAPLEIENTYGEPLC